MRKILINFAHPTKGRSKINMALRKAVEDIEGITVNDLYSKYPDFLIDIKEEQKLCKEHDVIMMQHPLYWFSVPAILREWQDNVFEYGWAHGSDVYALKDKIFLQAISAGAQEDTYHKDGFNKFSITELTSSFQASANLCKMTWLAPFCVFGAHNKLSNKELTFYSEEYRRTLIALRDDNLDIAKAKQSPYINEDLNSLIKKV